MSPLRSTTCASSAGSPSSSAKLSSSWRSLPGGAGGLFFLLLDLLRDSLEVGSERTCTLKHTGQRRGAQERKKMSTWLGPQIFTLRWSRFSNQLRFPNHVTVTLVLSLLLVRKADAITECEVPIRGRRCVSCHVLFLILNCVLESVPMVSKVRTGADKVESRKV